MRNGEFSPRSCYTTISTHRLFLNHIFAKQSPTTLLETMFENISGKGRNADYNLFIIVP